MSKSTYRNVWISDVHLGTRGCQAEQLLDFLKSIKTEKLYLVGDIIDGWRIKQKLYWPQSHSEVVQKILKMSKKGTDVIYITGNHDEFLRRFANIGLDIGNIRVVNQAQVTTVNNKRVLIVHGDEFDGVTKYHKWVTVIGDKAYDLLLVINRWYNKCRERMGMGYWSLSAYLKHKAKSAVNFIYDYEDSLARHCKSLKFDGIICGHIHHAEIKEIDSVMYYNTGDWVESCTALVEDYEGNINLIYWRENE